MKQEKDILKEETLRRVQELDEKYFGSRGVGRLVRALAAQVHSMEKEPTNVNLRKQAGDSLFVLVSMARNNGWDLEELLQEAITKIELRRKDHHYYECHVTIEPIFGKQLASLKALGAKYGFRIASLLMQKRKSDTPRRSRYDSFCTARGISYSDLEDRMLAFVAKLQEAGFACWRYKIESTLLDSRFNDSLRRLDRERLPEKERNPPAPAVGALPGRNE